MPEDKSLPSAGTLDVDDELQFLEELACHPQSDVIPGGWKVIVVDDEEQVHEVTRLALKNFKFAEEEDE